MDFYPLEKRHLGARRDSNVCGISEKDGWVCGFVDTNPN
jgi:hypothetical protein